MNPCDDSTVRMKTPKAQYSTEEAAQILGVTVAELQALVRSHVLQDAEFVEETTFQPSDLVILQILCNSTRPDRSGPPSA